MPTWSDDAVDIVATGTIGTAEWTLRWRSEGPWKGLLLFAGDSFGSLPPPTSTPVSFSVADVERVRVVWGLASPDTVAVRVTTTERDAVVAPFVGSAIDGHRAFVVALAPEQEPVSVESAGRAGGALHRVPLIPEDTGRSDIAARIDVRTVDRPAEAGGGKVVLEGAVDEATWEYAVRLEPPTWHDQFSVRTPSGGGGRGGGGGPLPGRETAGRLAVTGSGMGGGLWHVTGWADPRVTQIVLYLDTGERLRFPAGGASLGVDFVVFAVALPPEAVAVAIDGIDADGRVFAREHLRSKLSWIDDAIAEDDDLRARASAPVPQGVRTAWEVAFRTGFTEGARGLQQLRADDVAARWPFRPLLVPSPIAGHRERWVLHGSHERWEIGQAVGIGLTWISGPEVVDAPDPEEWVALLAAGAVIVRQSVSWSDPGGSRDAPNTTVRGLPALLYEHTVAANNLDHVMLSWHQPAESGLIEPLSGLWVAVEAHPRHHPVERVRSYAESLVPVP